MKRILQLWWLILAWLLAMFGVDFWHFNVMELFASIAIIIGAFFAIRSWCRDRRKKQVRQIIKTTLVEFLEEGQNIKIKCFEKNS
jgi:Flp pilus assembly protein TadB